MKAILLFISSLALLIGGCGSVSIPSWQKNVERYVREQGNGDAGSLRDMMLDDEHRGFAVIGGNLPSESTDVVGLLLAHRRAADKPRYIYLVAQVKNRQVRDIRLAALSVESGKFHWQLSRRNDAALQSYRDFSDSTWRSLYPNRKQPPDDYRDFPALRDRFTVDMTNGRVVVVTHELSGARWMLSL